MCAHLVSVIIPIYNVEAYLERCIESVINQTYKNIEVLLINDGSPDDSEVICLKYQEKDDRICYKKKSNGGLSSARNYGLRYAKGEYVYFLDSDDFIRCDTIEKLVNKLELEGLDIVSSGFCMVSESPDQHIEGKICEVTFEKYCVEDFFVQNISNHSCGKLIKTSLFKGIIFPEGMNYEDIATSYKLYMKANKISHTKEGLYFYRTRNDAITHQISLKNLLDLENVYFGVKEDLYRDSTVYKFYLLTILYVLFSRGQRLDIKNLEQRKRIEHTVYREMGQLFKDNDFSEFKGKSPMYSRIILLKYHFAKPVIRLVDFIRKIKN